MRSRPARVKPRAESATVKRFAVAVLVVCACLALAGCGAAVPDVTGKTVSQATGAIVSAGFRLGAVSYDEKSIGTIGSVVSQAPESGTTAKPGSVVALTVAGPAPVPVPALLGLEKAKAQAALAGVGLTLGVATESYDASAPAGVIASQTPVAGAEAPKGSAVAIVLSKGPEPVVVRRVKGKTQAEGKVLLEAAGFKVKVVTKDDKAKKGTVLAQQPAGGVMAPGSTIVITVSTGVAPMPVPVLGQPIPYGSTGFGKAHPVTVWGGGDPTSLVQHIKWASWGHATAVGHGKTVYFGDNYPDVASSPVEQATIVAWDLGMSHGHYIYRKVGWYFPQHGQTFSTIKNSPYMKW